MKLFFYSFKKAALTIFNKPGFTGVVVTTMGITLGVLVCILTLSYVLLLNPLPYPDQNRLYQLEHVYVDSTDSFVGSFFTYPAAIKLYEDKNIFEESVLSFHSEKKLTMHPSMPMVRTTYVTPGWFSMYDAKMEVGRAFDQSEAIGTNNPVSILSYDVWQEYFSGDKDVLGKTVEFWGINFKIIGVLSKDFVEPQLHELGKNSHIFMPWDFNPLAAEDRAKWDGAHPGLYFVGKLANAISASQAEQRLTSLVNDLWKEKVAGIDFFKEYSIKMKVQPLKTSILRDVEKTIYFLIAGVVGLLLMATVNIANQFVCRTAENHRKLAISAALGANKRQLFSSIFSETSLLMFLSVLLALVISSFGFMILRDYLAQKLPRVEELYFSYFTLCVAFFIAFIVALFFALLSSNMIDYKALRAALTASGKGSGAQVSKVVRHALIVSQVAMVSVLVLASVTVFRESYSVIKQPLGFETDNITTIYLNAWPDNAQDMVPTLNEITKNLEELAEVEAVSQAFSTLGLFDSPGHTIVSRDENVMVASLPVDSTYFRLIGQEFIDGEPFTSSDIQSINKVVIVNDVYAKRIAPVGSAIGEKIRVGGGDPLTVVGIVKGIKIPGETEVPMRAYYPWPEDKWRLQMLVKIKEGQKMPTSEIINIIDEIGAGGRVSFKVMEQWGDIKSRLLFSQYTTAIISAFLAMLSFFLAAVGLFGILDYSTQLRRYEVGTRMALGATRKHLIIMVIRDNGRLVLLGGGIALVVLAIIYFVIPSQFEEYINFDLTGSTIFTCLIVCGISFFSCYFPLRKFINRQVIFSLRGD